jgi:hypothetical protein
MRAVPLVIGLLLVGATTAYAQPPSSDPTRRLDLTFQGQPLSTGPFAWLPPDPKPLGVLTLLPPARPGEIVKFSLPVGEFAMRGIRAVASAQHRRAERKAKDKVQRELADFLARK